jgi:hypothetical protein
MPDSTVREGWWEPAGKVIDPFACLSDCFTPVLRENASRDVQVLNLRLGNDSPAKMAGNPENG